MTTDVAKTLSLSKGVTGVTLFNVVLNRSKLAGTARTLALVLAMKHNAKYGYAFPSHELLAAQCNCSHSALDRAIRALKDSGEWTVVPGRRGRLSEYYPTALLLGDLAITVEAAECIPSPAETPADLLPEPEASPWEEGAGEFPQRDYEYESVGVPQQRSKPTEPTETGRSEMQAHERVIREVFEAHESALWDQYEKQVTSDQRTALAARVREIESEGADLRLTLETALNRTRSVEQPAKWLLHYGLQMPRRAATQQRVDDAHGEFMMHGMTELTDEDYDDGGLGF